MNKVVFAEPNNQEAKNLQADALEQLGYQSETATWRNEYLMGAYELRNGTPKIPGNLGANSPDTIQSMPINMYLDYMGIRLNAEKAAGKKFSVNWDVPDLKEKYTINLENSVLAYRKVDSFKEKADVTMSMTKATLDSIQTGATTVDKEIESGNIKLTGDAANFKEYLGFFDNFKPDFNIVTP